ncbi:Erc1p NDAI_0D01590 [Naumovozyma dairenensis CBS 421]|uniref:Ethionine resistance protein n=1 Tax=Naumovozyma dairenensis (strain ATCC 10597 / BCRC 20456 / CBS 421 / NBRC 0211 / NRRL Y-12639) TaxID=1071378 RepID=G0W9L2_NAUDC|nr:hypothetical protein NDAI_0D01590 [Naumovozyma dairenensis CBS 421]CCD24473.1 hypothetical protein NDAI_0D01590 [Naumovozyma dairenensis CBS 421]
MPKQFVHTTSERRSSVIYSTSIGKGGLFVPSDYIPTESMIGSEDTTDDSNQEDQHFIRQDEEEITEYQSLLPENAPSASESQLQTDYGTTENEHPKRISLERRNSLPLLEEERELLIDNKLLNRKDDTEVLHPDNASLESIIESSNDIMNTWNNAIQSGKEIKTSYKRECKVIALNALPLIFTFILQNSLSLASIFSVSHLGTKELGGVTLGSMTANITGLAAIQGLCTCLDTLCSQAYGANNYHLVGVLVQRCAVITILAFLPIMYIWFSWSEIILSWMIPERELCKLAANYLKVTAFGVPGFILFECGKRFLQCQGIFHASTIILFVCAPLNALMNYILVWDKRIGIGYLGAPLSVAINYWLMTLGLIIYTTTTTNEANPLKCWNGLIKRRQVFKNWKKMFNLALPGIIMVEAEFLGFEILTIFSSHLGTAPLAAQSIVSTVASLAYQVPFSISVSTSTRVANFIGASLYKSCITTCKMALLLSFVCSSMNMFIIFEFKDKIAKLFSNESDVVILVVSTLPILACMQVFDAFNASTAGCLRGQGRQKIGGYINLFAFYCVGIPMAYLLAFKFNMGISGLWYGITCALIMMSICQGYAVFHCDWKSIIHAARTRNAENTRV